MKQAYESKMTSNGTTVKQLHHGILIYIDYKNPVYVNVPEGILASYFLLPVIVLGMLGNAAVIIRMPVTESIAKKLKMFYIMLAASDIGVLTVIHWLSMFPSFGVGFWTNGAVQWTALNVTLTLQVVVYVLWDVTKSVSAWTLALLSIERTNAVMRPFAATQWTFSRSAKALVGVNLWSITVPAVCTTFYFYRREIWGISLVHFVMTVLTNIIPLIIVITCGVILLPFHVAKRVRERKHMTSHDKAASVSTLSSSEVRNALALATVNAVYALSVGVPHSVDLAFPVQLVNVEIYNQTFAIARYMQFFSSIAYASNGYIYIFHLPSFRKAVFPACFA